MLRIATCQMTSGPDIGANVQIAESLIRKAAREGANLALLPEMFTIMSNDPKDVLRLAELYQIETDFIIGKGFVDPYSDDITEHYFQCKGFNDLGMENITKTMNAIAAEADKAEKSE